MIYFDRLFYSLDGTQLCSIFNFITNYVYKKYVCLCVIKFFYRFVKSIITKVVNFMVLKILKNPLHKMHYKNSLTDLKINISVKIISSIESENFSFYY